MTEYSHAQCLILSHTHTQYCDSCYALWSTVATVCVSLLLHIRELIPIGFSHTLMPVIYNMHFKKMESNSQGHLTTAASSSGVFDRESSQGSQQSMRFALITSGHMMLASSKWYQRITSPTEILPPPPPSSSSNMGQCEGEVLFLELVQGL